MISKKVFLKLSLGASLLAGQVLAEENSGWYLTGSIGASQIADLDIIDQDGLKTGEIYTFDSGLGLDLGFGYDFGSARLEGNWSRGQSPGGTDSGVVFSDNVTIDSILLSAYYDFRSTKQWSPFLGVIGGSTRVEDRGVDDTGGSYGFGFGLSYKTSNSTEVFYKSTALITPELKTLGVTNGVYGNGTIGVRFLF